MKVLVDIEFNSDAKNVDPDVLESHICTMLGFDPVCQSLGIKDISVTLNPVDLMRMVHIEDLTNAMWAYLGQRIDAVCYDDWESVKEILDESKKEFMTFCIRHSLMVDFNPKKEE